jgi:hypothetical protein
MQQASRLSLSAGFRPKRKSTVRGATSGWARRGKLRIDPDEGVFMNLGWLTFVE